jgi:catechol 2,3-dioxygenase-like lactoylglutathione lyase family enzyme
MSNIPTGSELIRPFLPCRNRAASTRFYEALGLKKLAEGDDVAIFGAGSGGFLLTDVHHEPLDGMLMMQMMVDDLDAWWSHIERLDLPAHFGVPAPRAPALQPWGLRIAYVVDPSGILWHVAERRDGVVHD